MVVKKTSYQQYKMKIKKKKKKSSNGNPFTVTTKLVGWYVHIRRRWSFPNPTSGVEVRTVAGTVKTTGY